MTLRRSILLLSLLLVIGWTATAQAGPNGVGTKTVRKVNTALSATMKGKTSSKVQEGKLLREGRKLLSGFLNIEELGQRALKDHWVKLGTAQRAEFLSLLRKLIETNYVKGLRSNLKYEVSYMGEENEGKHLLVQTVVVSKRKGRPLKIEIDYLLSKSEGKWRTFDIKTDGIGLVENYRAMFNKIIGKSGFEDLLKRMRKKLASLEG